MQTTITVLKPADQAAWEPLWQGYLAFYNAVVAADTTARSFARLTGGNTAMGGFLARRDGRAVGLVHWICHPSTWTVGDYCYLQDLYVDPDLRGGGVGRALIEAVYVRARQRDCSRVYWLTHESNAEAMKLYDRIADRSGFVQYRKVL
ncbi:MAG: GNAT family N-acetyltransferase [Bosea sp.]|nr:GNAT family N-acetyltransferase [Bosea sp. (in: a-proteobacteria)]